MLSPATWLAMPRRRASPPSAPASAGSSTSASTIARSSTISQPTAISPVDAVELVASSSARSSTTVLATESASPNTSPAPSPQPQKQRQRHTEQGRDRDLPDGAGNGDPAHGHQVGDGEVQADAEHQQDDADFGQLACECGVTDEPGRERTDRNAGKQVADQGRQSQLVGDHAADKGEDQTHRNGGDQRDVVMFHTAPFRFGVDFSGSRARMQGR